MAGIQQLLGSDTETAEETPEEARRRLLLRGLVPGLAGDQGRPDPRLPSLLSQPTTISTPTAQAIQNSGIPRQAAIDSVAETLPPGNPISGMPPSPARPGPASTPGVPTVSMPSANPMVAGASGPQSLAGSLAPNPTLSGLDERVAAVNRLLGPAPQEPYTRHAFDARGNIIADPVSAGEHQNYQAQVADRASRMQALLGHLTNTEAQQTAAYNAVTGRMGVTNQGNTEQTRADERGYQAYTAALNDSMTRYPNRTPAQHHENASAASGVSSPRYLELLSARGTANPRGNTPGALPGSVPTAPAGTPVVNPQGPTGQTVPRNELGFGTTSDTEAGRPWAGIVNQLDEASGHVPARAAAGNTPAVQESKPTRTVGEFITRLHNSNPGMLAENLPAIRNYINAHWSNQEARDAERGISNRALGLPYRDPTALLGRNLSDNETGVDILAQHMTEVNRQPGRTLRRRHENFLRSQRGQPPVPE